MRCSEKFALPGHADTIEIYASDVHSFLWGSMIEIERLKQAMKEKSLSQAALARQVGISPAAIQQLLNGSSKTSRHIRSIARALDVSVSWLEGDSEVPFFDFSYEDKGIDLKNLEFIAHFNAGERHGRVTKQQVNFLFFDKRWTTRILSGINPSNVALVEMPDDAMVPTILRGDDVLMEERDKFDGDPDGIWYFYYLEELYIRRIRITSSGALRIYADNPLIAPFEVSLDEIGLGGKAIWFGRSLKSQR